MDFSFGTANELVACLADGGTGADERGNSEQEGVANIGGFPLAVLNLETALGVFVPILEAFSVFIFDSTGETSVAGVVVPEVTTGGVICAGAKSRSDNSDHGDSGAVSVETLVRGDEPEVVSVNVEWKPVVSADVAAC